MRSFRTLHFPVVELVERNGRNQQCVKHSVNFPYFRPIRTLERYIIPVFRAEYSPATRVFLIGNAAMKKPTLENNLNKVYTNGTQNEAIKRY